MKEPPRQKEGHGPAHPVGAVYMDWFGSGLVKSFCSIYSTFFKASASGIFLIRLMSKKATIA